MSDGKWILIPKKSVNIVYVGYLANIFNLLENNSVLAPSETRNEQSAKDEERAFAKAASQFLSS